MDPNRKWVQTGQFGQFGKYAQNRSQTQIGQIIFGNKVPSFKGTTISACLGDQQAALVGQNCLRPGQAKCTYGTGCFLLYNVGPRIVHSTHGLISTVAYKMGPNSPPVYALEGKEVYESAIF